MKHHPAQQLPLPHQTAPSATLRQPSRSFNSRLRIALAGLALGLAPAVAGAAEAAATAPAHGPGALTLALWSLPVAGILLAIALFPLIPTLEHWWEHNRNKLIVSLTLALLVGLYYLLRGQGYHEAGPGLASLGLMLRHSIVDDYIPFIILLFSLFTISGGIRLTGDIPAHPIANASFLFLGALLASLIGTTGASMVLIRPLLQINSERKHVTHTVVFFIFLVSNIGGVLLPVGDPPLFLGYLSGVPFLWTLRLTPIWLLCVLLLLAVYFVIDLIAYRHEDKEAIKLDETRQIPLTLKGKRNFLLLGGVVLAVGLLVPGRALPGTNWVLPNIYLREFVQLALCALSLWLTPRMIRKANHFNFTAIGEVACLFIGIFITMQVPIELLHLKGPELGLKHPMQFFWASGALSSFLDNAPTYKIFFETAKTLSGNGMDQLQLMPRGGLIPIPLLAAISLGSVFMGANTYIGNGPNFLVKSIAEHHGVRMPSFFGYMVYSVLILIPLFVVVSLICFR